MSGAIDPNASVYARPMPALNAVSDMPGAPPPMPPDMTMKYNTQLSPQEEKLFQAWIAKTGKGRDLGDYDLRGAWKADSKASTNGHLPDTWKKPNHPTFSDQSMYNGTDGLAGGKWIGDDKAGWSFQPGATNLSLYGLPNLEKYMAQREPGVKLLTMPPPPAVQPPLP